MASLTSNPAQTKSEYDIMFDDVRVPDFTSMEFFLQELYNSENTGFLLTGEDVSSFFGIDKQDEQVIGVPTWESVRLDHDYCLHQEAPSRIGSSVSTPPDQIQEHNKKIQENKMSRTVHDHMKKIIVKTSSGLRTIYINPEKTIFLSTPPAMRSIFL
ncbi:uncharacterized protein LOC124359816 isoform X1 [Homalodisca vitripennis]|uniref:uncharacterized protein LOC124359816 isoform X1 n=1 Tax=Homalodisca vitripennis TaxID=197043 RepID=UPI001EECE976|nr:uncharacterized protein LOC124359816 isoform X1 [Homalodisca vitripennis]XP_046668825.1 uncharacterized protein LOC124359816 isoform X1 [Homalodisca vitripennis]XP_046668826.1 uncharacterized protein LOC124359816 isoform X1 [Homalodisca vitripennis]